MDGFAPIAGNSETSCLADGSWKPAPPSCAGWSLLVFNSFRLIFLINFLLTVVCPVLSVSSDTKLILDTTNNQPGSTIHISCKPGHELKGSEVITCQVDGTWSDELPVCSLGEVIVTWRESLRCVNDGNGNIILFRPLAVCPGLFPSPNLLIDVSYSPVNDTSTLAIGTIVTFRCANGYLLSSSSGAMCNNDS